MVKGASHKDSRATGRLLIYDVPVGVGRGGGRWGVVWSEEVRN